MCASSYAPRQVRLAMCAPSGALRQVRLVWCPPSGDGESACDEGLPPRVSVGEESVRWRGICLWWRLPRRVSVGEKSVLRWGNLPVMKASAESLKHDEAHLMRRTWRGAHEQGALDEAHMTRRIWRGALDVAHMARRTWRGASVEALMTRCTWRGAPDEAHLTWRSWTRRQSAQILIIITLANRSGLSDWLEPLFSRFVPIGVQASHLGLTDSQA